MNTLNKKINNLQEIFEDLQSKKRFEDNKDYDFLIDNTKGGMYQTGIRLLEKGKRCLIIDAYIISTYNFGSFNDLENTLKKDCYLIFNKSNNNKNNNSNAVLITQEALDYANIEEKILNILFNTEGNKKQFKELDQDFLYIFLSKTVDGENYFLSDINIEKILMERQLKDF
jgi:DNA-binding sugar fermentation-stimulating protein